MQITALQFELAGGPCTRYLIAWLDENGDGRWCRHAHPDKSLLDVEPGDVIVHKRTQYTVLRVRPYRTNECRDESAYAWVGG